MSDPFYLTGPALISFSGGRTSAYMLWRHLQAHDGALPADVHVCFANTGKEIEGTLRFVHECATRWNVRVRWLEFIDERKSIPVDQRFDEVGYNSASRAGEPFDRLLARKVSGLPTQQRGWCTEYLKVKTMFWFMEAETGLKPGQFVESIGLRSDEGHRIKSLRQDARNKARSLIFPLSPAKVRKTDIFSFWAVQEFDLQLPRGTGNCDHCPFLGYHNRVARAQRDPAGVLPWAQHEQRTNFTFGRYHSFAEILGAAASSPMLPLTAEMDAECGTWCSE